MPYFDPSTFWRGYISLLHDAHFCNRSFVILHIVITRTNHKMNENKFVASLDMILYF